MEITEFFQRKGRKRDSPMAAVPRFNSSNSTSNGFFVGSVAARMKIIPLRSTYPPPPSAPLSAPGAKVRWRRNVLILLRQEGSLARREKRQSDAVGSFAFHVTLANCSYLEGMSEHETYFMQYCYTCSVSCIAIHAQTTKRTDSRFSCNCELSSRMIQTVCFNPTNRHALEHGRP